jgi:hypothetical protein
VRVGVIAGGVSSRDFIGGEAQHTDRGRARSSKIFVDRGAVDHAPGRPGGADRHQRSLHFCQRIALVHRHTVDYYSLARQTIFVLKDT